MPTELIVALIETMPLPVVVVDPQERVFAANGQAQALLGAAMVGRHYLLTLRQPVLQAAIGAALAKGQAGTAPHVIPGPSQDVTFRVQVAPLGQTGFAVLSFEDVTAAEQMEQMRRDFVANVSHELRTPLTALLGFIETLKGAARDDAVARTKFLDIMEREAGRMNRLVSDLLHLSRVEAEERLRPTSPVDLAGLLTGAVAALRHVADQAGVRLVVAGLSGPIAVPGDGDQITQVLVNLIENAIKYGARAGAVTITLAREGLPHGTGIAITVADQGDGIEAQHLPRLTERFYRIDGHRSREMGGTGLGLAIVKHIVNRHRGRMRIESEKGKGSRFTVIFPES